MIIKRNLFEKYDNYIFGVPYKENDRVLVNKGDKIKEGTDIIEKYIHTSKYSFYLPTQIGCEQNKAEKYVSCMDGELVTKGSVLAERMVAGGLSIKKLISPCEGVVDLTKIKSGYLDILGEENTVTLKSSFSGKVEDVNPLDGIVVKSPASAIDIKAISDIVNTDGQPSNKKIFGEFVTLGDGKEVLLKAEGDDYHNKIVFVGKHLHPKLLHDLFEKGADFVLTYSMDYQEFRKQGLPVGVFGGFGDIYCSDEFCKLVSSMKGSFAIMDYNESQLFFLNDLAMKNKDKNIFLQKLNGATVKSLSSGNYSMLGTIIDLEEDKSDILVKWENGRTGNINIGNVEFVSIKNI
ncbi:hypothetical protein J6Z48_02850 [bacterium]|nr:hypothetical protein [bacterium]